MQSHQNASSRLTFRPADAAAHCAHTRRLSPNSRSCQQVRANGKVMVVCYSNSTEGI